MAPVISSVKTCALGPPRPFPPSVPPFAGRQLVRSAAYASDSREILHCFLVGANKSYVIATSDLRLFFIHASNLLPSLPTALPYNKTSIDYFFFFSFPILVIIMN